MSRRISYQLSHFSKAYDLSSIQTELSIPGVPLTKGRMTILPDKIRVDESCGGYAIIGMDAITEMRLDARPIRIFGKPGASYVRSIS